MRIRVLLAGATLLLSALAGLADRPNVLVIYTDDQGYGDASCLNPDSKFQTPNIDRLAAEGILFTDGHCSDSVCTPSRYGLLTGRYNWRTTLKRGVFGAEAKCLIADGRMTLASFLRDHGYRTAMVGKWHLGMTFPGDFGKRDWTQPVTDMPLDKGFESFWGIPASMNYGVLAWFNGRYASVPPTLFTRKKDNEQAIADYRIMPPYEQAPRNAKDLEVAPDFVDNQCLTRFTEQAMMWIRERAPDAREGKPFFLYLPYTAPHKPVAPIDQFRGKSAAGAYGDFMLETDWHVGQLLDLLEKEKLARNTLVVLTSDNGPENTWAKRIDLFDHHSAGLFRDGKRSAYEGGHRVPFIVRWPDKVSPGRTWDKPVCQTDLLATLAAILGEKLPDQAGEDSFSFVDVLTGAEHPATRPPLINHAMDGRFAVREGQWKLLMEHGKQSRELYDLSKDPGETNNVLADHPEIERKLVADLTRIVQEGRSTPGAPQSNDTGPWPDLTWMK